MVQADQKLTSLSVSIANKLARTPPRATHFIVTLFGDVASARNDELWVGTIINCCARHGISASLVRTAVSRLVSAGKLKAKRIGKKGYYHLTETAKEEFNAASQILYAPKPAPEGWILAISSGQVQEIPTHPWAQLREGIFIAPDQLGLRLPKGLCALKANVIQEAEDMAQLSGKIWDLNAVASAYYTFLDFAADILQLQEELAPLDGATSLDIRLRLVHTFRQAALYDPNLPRYAQPDQWPGYKARQTFQKIYLQLSENSDNYLGQVFRDSIGLLSTETAQTRRRLKTLHEYQQVIT
ncbi:PaaX family transcriptional regulator C-terminal domain-containing protein [Flexibacterium corallicola]|uniref:PaaX family transcriptional regulator C-terminal domain-containing protein n=1 Tax=Flexibacterium corallicola TaxID=3037259 RepID=UPI00286F5AF7|nr:PaaX family transcriptional regulator C-terminal domain-containing protein [Pseudovibrio sp. M1P-2-3]